MDNAAEVIALPRISMLDRSPRRILFEHHSGRRFYIIGGKDRRPPPKGVAWFTPREMLLMVNNDLPEEVFLKLCRLKETGMGQSIAAIIQPEGEDAALV